MFSLKINRIKFSRLKRNLKVLHFKIFLSDSRLNKLGFSFVVIHIKKLKLKDLSAN